MIGLKKAEGLKKIKTKNKTTNHKNNNRVQNIEVLRYLSVAKDKRTTLITNP